MIHLEVVDSQMVFSHIYCIGFYTFFLCIWKYKHLLFIDCMILMEFIITR